MTSQQPITVETIVNAPLEKVWEYWNEPQHITGWAFAQNDWEALNPENDLREGGKFKTTMAAKDKSVSFDFTGVYTKVGEHEMIEYTMDDPEGDATRPYGAGGRHVKVEFKTTPDGGTKIVETFDPENENPPEMQRAGWQAILDNFKKYTENFN
jgi:uncharacterized protein YndB with AHSA1/START domain